MTKRTVLPRSGAANESLPAPPRAHAHIGTHRVKNILRSARRAMVGVEKNELFDWKEWMSSEKVRSRTKAFFNPLYRRIAAKRIGVAVMTANNSIRGRRSRLQRGTRKSFVRKERFTNAEKDLLFYKKLLKELNKRRKREMQDGAETPCSNEWRQVMKRLGPMDACGAIKNLNETVFRKVIPAGRTWFSELGKQLEIAGKECVPKGKPAAAAVGDDDSQDLALPTLSRAMVEEVAAALEPEPASEVLVSGFRLNISRSDIGTLNDNRWLNDEIINFYLSVIMERSGTEEAKEKAWPRVYAFNTFFYPKLAAGGYAAVKRWTRSVDLFSFDILLVPLHCTMHWCLAAVDFRKRTICYYDSLKSQGDKKHFLHRLQSYIEDESQGKKNKGIDWDAWVLIDVEDLPQQDNMNDCGVFICQYSECLSRDAPMVFGQQHMPYFRERMTYEVLHKAILSE